MASHLTTGPIKRWAMPAFLILLVLGGIASIACLKIKRYQNALAIQKLSPSERIAKLLPVRGEKINYGFHVQDDKVFFETDGRPRGGFLAERLLIPICDADPKSFKPLQHEVYRGGRVFYFAADAKHVYIYDGHVSVLDADPSTFRLLDSHGRFACDARNVFFMGRKIDGADAATFERLAGDFSKDEDQAFVGNLPLSTAAETFDALSPGYLQEVWPTVGRGRQFEGWWSDGKQIYFGQQAIEDADLATFESLGYVYYAKDANHVYRAGTEVKGAEPATFEVIGAKYWKDHFSDNGPDARDKHQAYLYGDIYTGPLPEEMKNTETMP